MPVIPNTQDMEAAGLEVPGQHELPESWVKLPEHQYEEVACISIGVGQARRKTGEAIGFSAVLSWSRMPGAPVTTGNLVCSRGRS